MNDLITHTNNPKIMIYIKPWDETVFENFFIFLRTVQELQVKFSFKIDVNVPSELYTQFEKSVLLKAKYDVLDFVLKSVDKLTDDIRSKINFIVTLGGDGTILWASK